MTPERVAKIKELRQRLANLTEAERQAYQIQGMISTVDGHTLSLKNTILIKLQYPQATVVGGYQQWLKANKKVNKGQHGFTIWFPTGNKDDETSEVRFLTTTVFDISQVQPLWDTEPIDKIEDKPIIPIKVNPEPANLMTGWRIV